MSCGVMYGEVWEVNQAVLLYVNEWSAAVEWLQWRRLQCCFGACRPPAGRKYGGVVAHQVEDAGGPKQPQPPLAPQATPDTVFDYPGPAIL